MDLNRYLSSMAIRSHPDPYEEEASGGSALLDAINRGKLHLTKFVLDAMQDSAGVVNTRDFNGKTPLMRAVYVKEERTRGRIINLLLQKRCDVNIKDDRGRTALSYACEMRCNDVVQILVRNNVDPDIQDNQGNTALHYNAIVGNDKGIEILLKSFRRLGLRVDHPNKHGMTPLLICAAEGHLACAQILAESGRADTSRTDPRTGLTAEELARDQGCTTPEVFPFSHNKTKRRRRHTIYDPTYTSTSRSRTNVTARKRINQFQQQQQTRQPKKKDSILDSRARSVAPLRQPLSKLGTKDLADSRLPDIHLHGCHYVEGPDSRLSKPTQRPEPEPVKIRSPKPPDKSNPSQSTSASSSANSTTDAAYIHGVYIGPPAPPRKPAQLSQSAQTRRSRYMGSVAKIPKTDSDTELEKKVQALQLDETTQQNTVINQMTTC